MTDIEKIAEAELRRIESFEALLATNEMIPEASLLNALCDESESLRAEALDYLPGISPSDTLLSAVVSLSRREIEVQCVARLAFLSYVWESCEIRNSITYRPTIDEAEYILAWDYAGRVRSQGDKVSLLKLCVQAGFDDWEMSNLAQNLLSSVLADEHSLKKAMDAIERIATDFGMAGKGVTVTLHSTP